MKILSQTEGLRPYVPIDVTMVTFSTERGFAASTRTEAYIDGDDITDGGGEWDE